MTNTKLTAVVELFIGIVATVISVVAEEGFTDACEVIALPLTLGTSCNSQHANVDRKITTCNLIRFVSKITDVRLTAFLFVLIIVFLGTVLDAVTLLGDVDARSVPARVLVALETR